jgi:hypothetical protein
MSGFRCRHPYCSRDGLRHVARLYSSMVQLECVCQVRDAMGATKLVLSCSKLRNKKLSKKNIVVGHNL